MRGMRGGRGMAVGGGAGIVGIIIVLLITVLGGGNIDLSALQSLDGVVAGGQQQQGEVIEECRTGEDAEKSRDCRLIGTVNSIQAYWSEALNGYRPAVTVFFSGSTSTGCGSATSDVGSVLLPGGPEGLRRPRVLPGAAGAVRRRGGSVRGGVRPRARVRASRAEPHGRSGADRRRPARVRRARPCGRSFRPTATPGCGRPTRSRRDPGLGHGAADHAGAGRGGGGRRRPHPATDPGPGQSRSPGRTAPPCSARSGSAPGYRTGDPNDCDTFSGSV